jgi:benzoyl-CoA reductase/2-hydroxyglutaryl-CoA dehydratase subunit BcrC/BadD/HgdB
MNQPDNAWERMAKEANHLFRSKLSQPLSGADLLWLSVIITRHSGDKYARIKLDEMMEKMEEAANASP